MRAQVEWKVEIHICRQSTSRSVSTRVRISPAALLVKVSARIELARSPVISTLVAGLLFILPGFDIARKATNQTELQLRMQGNAFLGAFFRVSPFLNTFGISEDQFQSVVRQQYVKKFGRFGDAVDQLRGGIPVR